MFRTKNLSDILHVADQGKYRLKRVLSLGDLTSLGVGAIIGAGIFVLVGTAAAGSGDRLGAGPALMVSFILTAVACGFAALCYAEFASVVPISGSAYTYSYFTFGEVVAWIIGWDLILEYAVGNIAVAISWSGYFVELLRGFHIALPVWLTTNYNLASQNSTIFESAPYLFGFPIIINLPAVLIVAVITLVLVIGIKESSRFNTIMVIIKLVVLLFFILLGAFYVKPENWQPFIPNGWGSVMTGAALVFFAYIGFDAISTVAEETKNPQRDLPLAMIGSLAICTVFYIAVAAVLMGIVPYQQLNVPEPLALAFSYLDMNWAAGIVAFGAVVSTTAVLLVFQLGQPRIFFAMSRDGLLPRQFAKVHARYQTPHVTTILTGAVVAFFAAFMDIGEAAELTNIGTLFAFILVCAGVIILRWRQPDLERPFRCPWVPLIPMLGIVTCSYLMISLPWITWVRFFVWLGIGMAIYLCYGRRHSKLVNQDRKN